MEENVAYGQLKEIMDYRDMTCTPTCKHNTAQTNNRKKFVLKTVVRSAGDIALCSSY